MNKYILFAGAALFALAACGGADASDAQANVATAADANAADAHGEEGGSPNVLLEANAILPAGTEESRIAFGANSLDTIEQVTPILGETYDKEESAECGAGPMEFASWDNVVLMFSQGEFVGWELRAGSEEPWIGTPGGITIGSPRADLAAALGAAPTVEQTSLGTEFNGGGYTGLLSADTPDATVTALWAGTNCIMR